MKADVILGLQWGDEGKGKIVDRLAPEYDIIARFQGGPNAGHTIEINGSKHILHQIPSGIFHPGITNLIGNGVLIDPVILFHELQSLSDKGLQPEHKLLISRRAHLILPTHRLLDAAFEMQKKDRKIGSTLKGIGPAYTDKTARMGIRVGEIFSKHFDQDFRLLRENHLRTIESTGINPETLLIDGKTPAEYEAGWLEAIEKMRALQFVDGEIFLNQALTDGKKVLAEGAQGTLLDLDYGSYPYVTSSSTMAGGVCTGLGIPPSSIGNIFGVFKAYCTRVGNGPFPTELFDETGQKLRELGNEYGSTTGRPRRCGWLDIPALKYSIMINGVNKLVMMKADVLNTFPSINICTAYHQAGKPVEIPGYQTADQEIEPIYNTLPGWTAEPGTSDTFSLLPENLRRYIEFIENQTKTLIPILSLGPERNQTIVRNF